MFAKSSPAPYICTRCLRGWYGDDSPTAARLFSRSAKSLLAVTPARRKDEATRRDRAQEKEEEGAMSRRLSELTESILEDGARGAEKTIKEAGFDDELREKLLNRIADASFQEQNRQAFVEADLKDYVGKGSRDIATAEPWLGTEAKGDAVLRMLDDSRKRIRRPSAMPGPAARPPKKVDTGRPNKAPSSGARLANARDKSSMYSYLKDENLPQNEREQYRKELKERFTPNARAVPTTLRGLASLANERIEDAIARGQFKNLPRGKKIERDYNASSPFLDTTEYFMNKIIQRQEIVPPWIEKQQELVENATKFRSRLRADWRRHAARLIASRGGSLESQILRAQEYARAEDIVNPTKRKEERLNTVDDEGHVSQISLSGKLQTSLEGTPGKEVKIEIVEQPASEATSDVNMGPSADTPISTTTDTPSTSDDPRVFEGAVFPFRDPHWEDTERSYHKVAVDSLNTLTRSYNLMAPNLAKKPYFSLERELRNCFADVAPQLADEVSQRARAPKLKIDIAQTQSGGLLKDIAGGSARVYDETRPQYGFKQFWRDLFSKENSTL